MATRDLTEKQFQAALKRNGMSRPGVFGYVDVGNGVQISVWNAGAKASRRQQLAFLIADRDRTFKREAERHEKWLRQEEARKRLMLPPHGTAAAE